MGLESIFAKAWQDFKRNIYLSLKSAWWFIMLPLLILFLILVFFIVLYFSTLDLTSFSSGNYTDFSMKNFLTLTGNVVQDNSDFSLGLIFMPLLLAISILVLAFFINTLVLLYSVFYNESGKLKFNQAVHGSFRYFWRFAKLSSLMILVFLFLISIPAGIGVALFLLLKESLAVAIILLVLFIVLALIVYMYVVIKLIFSPFVLVRENTGVIEAISRSILIVKGRWWQVFGYTLLFSLIISGISSVISSFIQMFFYLFYVFIILSLFLGPIVFGFILFFLGGILFVSFGIIINLSTLASFALFKNLYLELRTKRK